MSELWAAAKGAPPLAVLAGVAAAAAIYKVGSSFFVGVILRLGVDPFSLHRAIPCSAVAIYKVGSRLFIRPRETAADDHQGADL